MSEQRDAILARARALQAAYRDMMEKLVDLRDEHGMSQTDVANRMGVSQSAVAQFERYDANPTLATIRRYALAVEAEVEIRVTSDRARSRSFEAEAVGAPMRLEPGQSRAAVIDWRGTRGIYAVSR